MGKIEKNKNSTYSMVSKSISVCFTFVSMMTLSAASIGTLFVFFDIKWGLLAILMNVVIASILTIKANKIGLFDFENYKEIVCFVLIEIVLLLIYKEYAPALVLSQDPAAYLFRALNLSNYGYDYKPMPIYGELVDAGVLDYIGGYGKIQNGTIFSQGKLEVDFFPAGSFVYATFGYFLKNCVFWGQTLIVMLSGGQFFFVLKKIIKEKFDCRTVVLYILSFFVAPLIVFFGRGSFSENISLMMLLFLLNILGNEKIDSILLIVSFLVLYSARMDYMVFSIVGIFIVTYYSMKCGIIYSLMLFINFYLYNASYAIYSTRIMNADMKILKYSPLFIVLVCVISLIICKYCKNIIVIVYKSKITKAVVLLVTIVAVLMMFMDNLAEHTGYDMAMIHGSYIMTYQEFILDLLCLVFPPLLLIGGVISLYNFVGKSGDNMILNIFIVLACMVYLYFLFKAGNSPQLYWFLRRHMYVLLPIATLSFVAVMSNYDFKINAIIGGFVLLTSINCCLNAKLGVDYEDLDKQILTISERWEEEGIEIVLYDSDVYKTEVSPLVVYSELEVIPVPKEKLGTVYLYLKDKGFNLEKCIFLSNEDINNGASAVEFSYERQGENFGAVPTERHKKSILFYEYPIVQLME